MNQLENILTLHARRYPAMEAADYIKLLYQSEFGPGHMVAEGDALACLQTEFAQAEEEGYAPAYTIEAIGGGLCRFSGPTDGQAGGLGQWRAGACVRGRRNADQSDNDR